MPLLAPVGGGTMFVAKYLTDAGVHCSHEAYYTTIGPYMHNDERYFGAKGDASWLAVPYLPDPGVITLHQIRHPFDVIKSLYKMGFFDDSYNESRGFASSFVKFSRKHFEISEDPLQSSLRWYIDWNKKCEAITDKRYKVEDFHNRIEDISEWLKLKKTLPIIEVSTQVNTRIANVSVETDNLKSSLQQFPEYEDLEAMAADYGYDL